MRTNNCLGLMAVVVFSSGNALALCTTSVEGTSSADSIALCMRYSTGEDRVWAARCTSGSLTWIDVCDSYGTLTDDVTIAGLAGNDILATVDGFTIDLVIGSGCTISCYAEVDLDTYTVTLDGGTNSDTLTTGNETGPVILDGGADDDLLIVERNYSGNYLYGDTGNDVLTDAGGTADFLLGEGNNDCLQHDCPGSGDMDCGDGSDDDVAWAGWATCCPGGPELCQGPERCENYVGTCFP